PASRPAVRWFRHAAVAPVARVLPQAVPAPARGAVDAPGNLAAGGPAGDPPTPGRGQRGASLRGGRAAAPGRDRTAGHPAEPVGRNTAPAIAVAALEATAGGSDPLLLV